MRLLRSLSGTVLVSLAALLAVDGLTAGTATAANAPRIIAVLGPLGDPFFSTMQKGTEDAAKAAGANFTYTAPSGFDNLSQDLARLIDIGVGQKPDAMVIGNFIPDAENEGIRAAIAAGITVVVVNTGAGNWQDLGALNFVGEDSTAAGRKAAELFVKSGAKKGFCVNHVPGNPSTEARCGGFKQGMEAGGGKATIFNLPYASQGNPQQIVQSITGALTADPSIDAVYTLGSGIAQDAMQAVDDGGFGGRVKLGTSDVSLQTLEATRDGKLLFDIDQQPYLQGYDAVQIAAQYLKFGIHPIGTVVTGPLALTKDNVAAALDPAVVPYRGAK